MNSKSLLYILIALGLIISIYLTIVHFEPGALACPKTGIIDCESVLTSQYSSIFGIPVAVLGLILFLLAIFMLLIKPNDTMKFLWSIAGTAAVLYSLTSQALIGLFCIYCLALDIVIVATVYVVNRKNK